MNERVRVTEMKPMNKNDNRSSRKRKPPFSQPAGSTVDRVIFLQRTIGNQSVKSLFRSKNLKAKLRVRRPGNKYEQDADRVGEAIVGMPETKVISSSTPDIQRSCLTCEEQKQQSMATSGHMFEISPNLETQIRSLKGGGQPLSESNRAFYEPLFSRNFSHVKVHTDAEAVKLARLVNARAFTVGKDIVFNAGQYAPERAEGKKLLAHELTHVVQQGEALTDHAISRRKDTGRSDRPQGQEDPSLRVDNVYKLDPDQCKEARGIIQRTVTNLAVAGAMGEAGIPDHFVTATGAGPVTITATVSAAGQRVRWTGGRVQPGNNLQHMVPVGASGTTTVTADTPADPGPQSVTVHVVKGRPAPAAVPADLGFSRQPGNPPGLAPFGLTDVRTNNPVPLIRAGLAGNQWAFRVERIRHRYLLGITGGGNIDIRTANNVPKLRHCEVITDLTPPAPGAANGPPRASFWSSPITLAHENAHVARFYSPPFWEAFMRIAEANIEAVASNIDVNHTIPATLSDTGVVAANAAAHQAIIDAQHAAADAAEIGGSEVFAHGQSNPMYATLIARIASHFRPLAPTGLVALALGPTNIQLNWNDNACNETEYRVYRRRAGGAFTQIATLPAGSVTFTDSLAGLAGNTDFTYFITAVGVAGESDKSNRAAIHTP